MERILRSEITILRRTSSTRLQFPAVGDPLHFDKRSATFMSEAEGVQMSDRIELPQGTLDLLILKALALEPQHGWAIVERLHQLSTATDKSARDPCTQRSIAWPDAAGSKHAGARRTTIDVRSTTS